MRFAVLSDTHYISKSTLYNGGANSPRDVLRHEINRKVFDDLKARTDLDTILITGDLTDAGDMVEYIRSLTGMSDLQKLPEDTIRSVLEQNMTAGVLRIPKEYGMFIAR